jgi:hypothetical protein
MASTIKPWTDVPEAKIKLPFCRHFQLDVDVMIKEQTKIGLEHFFQGYTSGTWGCISIGPLSVFGQTSLADKKKHLDYKKWQKTDLRLELHQKALCLFNAVANIKALQTYTLALYGAQNNILHDSNEETAVIINKIQFNEEIQKIQKLYHDKETFSACNRA